MSRLRPLLQRRLRLVAALVALLLVGGGLAVAAVGGGHRVKVVHVVVTVPMPAQPHRPAVPPTGLAPASAGSNGSFTPPASSGDDVLRAGARAAFARFAATLPGPVDLALAPLGAGDVITLGGDTPAHGWSTTKVPVLTALLRARGGAGLTASEQSLARLAITQSDNGSILDLFGDLQGLKGGLIGASDYVQGLFRDSGDDQTAVATAPPPPGGVTTFGQTEWAPGQAVKFFRALANGCLVSGEESNYLLGLMEEIVPSESWGLGEAGFSVPVAFKGGWGPEGDAYLVRQSGIVDPGSSRGVAVSIVAYPPAGGDSFDAGTEMLTQTARWLAHELELKPRSGVSCAPS